MRLLVFGNPYLAEDSFANHVASHLDSWNPVFCTSPDDILQYEDEEFVVLDVVKSIDKVVIIYDINTLKTRNIMSLHDFDLGFFLRLCESMGVGQKITIIGIPQKGDLNDIVRQVRLVLVKLSRKIMA